MNQTVELGGEAEGCYSQQLQRVQDDLFHQADHGVPTSDKGRRV